MSGSTSIASGNMKLYPTITSSHSPYCTHLTVADRSYIIVCGQPMENDLPARCGRVAV